MELTIFKKDQINFSIFENEVIYKYIEYSEISELKKKVLGEFQQLDLTKSKIDLLDKNSERSRRAAAKYIHEYELIKLICKKQVISRSYFKLYEILYHEEIITSEKLNCFFICEAPGGFIECVNDIRRKKNLRTEYLSVSKNNDIKYDRYLDENNLMYSDILVDYDIVIKNVLTRFPNKLDLITADGGFDIKIFNAQEVISQKLLLSEIYLALSTQKVGGMFVIKFFDMFTHNSTVMYLMLCSLYECVKIIKPCSSRNCNSERYIVCKSFRGIYNDTILNNIREILKNYVFSEPNEKSLGISTMIYPYFETPVVFNKKMNNFNNLILYEQIKTINESIKMVNTKDVYIQNLILRLFMEKISVSYLLFYKNILYSRIKKCIQFLRNYNINTNQFVYRFE